MAPVAWQGGDSPPPPPRNFGSKIYMRKGDPYDVRFEENLGFWNTLPLPPETDNLTACPLRNQMLVTPLTQVKQPSPHRRVRPLDNPTPPP